MDKLIDVGQIVNTHGLRGEVKVNIRTDAPEVFELFDVLYTEKGTKYDVKGVRYQKGCVLLKLGGIEYVDEAEKLRGTVLYADREIFSELPDDTYLVADIIGLEVKEGDTIYGKICDVITTGSNDVYSVKTPSNKMIYIPAIKSVVREISIRGGYIEINMPKGLVD